MRIAAVMGGASGNTNAQYVELRMTLAFQNLVAGHQIVFQDSAATVKAVFTFPSLVSNSASGASILVATKEFAQLSGMRPDFFFTNANTAGSNGGDPLHPIQSTGGRVIFREDANPGGTAACHPQDTRTSVNIVDSVAYGSYPAVSNNDPDNPSFAGFGTPATALDTSGSQALILTDNSTFINDSAEYTLLPLPASPDVPAISPPTSPRSNNNTTGTVPLDDDQDLVGNGSDNCVTTANSDQEDYDGDGLGNACDSEDDGDGYSDTVEAGTPLCNGINDDASDDAVVDDGCPGGPAQAGSFSEAQFKIGTNPLGRCGVGVDSAPSNSWPSDFTSGGTPNSTDKVTITDITSFLAPAHRLNTSPGDTNFNSRWDLVPGKNGFPTFIALNDLTALIAGGTGFPAMFGGSTKAYNGPACTGATVTVNMGDFWFGGSACGYDDAGSCASVTVDVGDSVRWTNAGATGHTATHCPDGSLSSCSTPPARAFDTSPPDGSGTPLAPANTSSAFSFSTAGTYLYRCQLHPGPSGAAVNIGMRGRVVVID